MVREFINIAAFSFLALFPIVNPPAMTPIFLDMTSDISASERNRLAGKISWYTLILLLIVLFVGGWILKLLDISIHVIRIAGGILLFNMAWQMLNSDHGDSRSRNDGFKSDSNSKVFFPMTMPITAGPGTIAVTLTLIPTGSLMKLDTWLNFAGVAAGIALMSFVVFVSYRYSGYFFGRLGKQGIQAVTKLSAFILLAIGVEIIWKGYKGLIS
jgi:multiple antibiotic resistance protein